MWPIEINDVVVGSRFKRSWVTPAGKKRHQVREIIEIGEHLRHYEPQMNRDCCRYLIVDGWRSGKEGKCTRSSISFWAQEKLNENSERHD